MSDQPVPTRSAPTTNPYAHHRLDRALRVGLTGGIGSGKTSVATRLAELGAVVVDADTIARQVVEPGTAGLAAVLEEFGPEMARGDGTLDRSALGRLVFTDELARARLEGIVLPLIAAEAAASMEVVPAGQVIVYDMPLLVESQAADMFDVVLVVETALDTRLDRLVARGMDRDHARARIEAQATDAERRAVADVVLDNSGTLDELRAAVDRLWADLAPTP